MRGGCHVNRLHPAVISLLNMGIVRVLGIKSAGGGQLKLLDDQCFGLDHMPVDSLIVIASPLIGAMLLSSSSFSLMDVESLEFSPEDKQ